MAQTRQQPSSPAGGLGPACWWVLGAGLLLRVVAALRREWFVDELHALHVASLGWGQLWAGLKATPGIAPLDYGWLTLITGALPPGKWLRLGMVLAQMAGLWQLCRLALARFGGPVALAAALLGAFSPMLVDQAASIRPYGLAFLMGAVALVCLLSPGQNDAARVKRLGAGGALALGFQFFLGPVVLWTSFLLWLAQVRQKGWRGVDWPRACLGLGLPLVVFGALFPLWGRAGDMKAGPDNVASVVLSLVQTCLAFGGWGCLPVGVWVAVLAAKGAKKLPPVLWPWGLVLFGVVFLSQMREQVHVLARHYAPLWPLFVLAGALALGRWLGAGGRRRVALAAALLLLPALSNEAQHPRLWLMGLDLRSDFERDLNLRHAQAGQKQVWVGMGFLDGLWRYVLARDLALLDGGEKIQVLSPAQVGRAQPGTTYWLLRFGVPAYLDPTQAGLGALGFAPPPTFRPPVKGARPLGSFAVLVPLSVARGAAAASVQGALLEAYDGLPAPVTKGPFAFQLRLNHDTQRAALLCRVGKGREGLAHLLRLENTVKEMGEEVLRPFAINWGLAKHRCLAATGAPARQRLGALLFAARRLGLASGALRVQSGYSARVFYRLLAREANAAGDGAALRLARQRLKQLDAFPLTEPSLWP